MGVLLACSGAADLDLFAQGGDSGSPGVDSSPGVDTGTETDSDIPPGKDAGGKKDAAGQKDTGLPDTNGGVDASDAGKACNATTNSANDITSLCNPGFSFPFGGGKFTSGHYDLEEINVLGNKAICDAFVQTTHRGAFDLVADGNGDNAVMDIVLTVGGVTERRTVTLASPGFATTLTATETCPTVQAAATWNYDTFGKGGKRFRFQAPFGQYQAVFVFSRP